MPRSAPDEKEFRQAILDTLHRTNEPMLSKQIAEYLVRRGWKGNVAARVPSHLTTLRARGQVASMTIPTGGEIFINGRWFEDRKRAWFLSSMSVEEAARVAMSKVRRGRLKFRAPPEPYARTDDMRQMLVDMSSVSR